MGERIFTVDAFAEKPFSGNPAGVCLLSGERPVSWMQGIAGEMNLSETAFLLKEYGFFKLRWFTPAAEVELCGHATLASAHVLWEIGILRSDEAAVFETLSGRLTAIKADGRVFMDFPAEEEMECPVPEEMVPALGFSPVYCGRNRFDYLLEFPSDEIIRSLDPDFNLLKKISGRGIIVTSRSRSGDYDFISRFFAPGVGVNEDPVTGSAHCCLGPYWGKKLGKDNLDAYQASPRGGRLSIENRGERVLLGGTAVTVIQGEICL